MSNLTLHEKADRFVTQLSNHQEDRGAMASLRRGLSPHTEQYAWPIIARFGGQIGWPSCQIIGALFALHPSDCANTCFGTTCRLVAQRRGLTPGQDNGIDARFRRLLACGEDTELGEHLRHWVMLAAGQGVPVDYRKLFVDLACWNGHADYARVTWAKAFWNGEVAE